VLCLVSRTIRRPNAYKPRIFYAWKFGIRKWPIRIFGGIAILSISLTNKSCICACSFTGLRVLCMLDDQILICIISMCNFHISSASRSLLPEQHDSN
jgi:hypothetical protein